MEDNGKIARNSSVYAAQKKCADIRPAGVNIDRHTGRMRNILLEEEQRRCGFASYRIA